MKRSLVYLLSFTFIFVFGSIAYADLNDGLVAYYPFNCNANDESGNGNHGTVKNGAKLTNDKFGNANSAYDFDGIDDYIELPPMTLGGAISIEAMVLRREINNSAERIIDLANARFEPRDNSSISDAILIGWRHPYNGAQIFSDIIVGQNNGNSSYLWSSETFPVNEWTHVVYVNDGNGNGYFYQNDELEISGNQARPSTVLRESNWIGRSNFQLDPYFDGIMDHLRIYNRALSEEEIHALFAGDTDGDGIPDTADNCSSTPNPNQEDSDSNSVDVPVKVTAPSHTISVSPTNLSIDVGLTDTISITGGIGIYEVTSSDTSIATVSLSGDTVTITGVAEGTAMITVEAVDSPSAEVTVVVTDLSTAEIDLISPRDNDMLSHSGEGGQLVVMFTSSPDVEYYMLNVNLVDMYRVSGEVPLLIPLELPTEGSIFDPGTGGTEGFSCSFGMCTYTIEFSQESWNGLAQWDIEWYVDALNAAGEVIGSSETWSFKFQPTGSVTLSSPIDGASFDKTTGTALRFGWEVYTGADTYMVLLGKVAGLEYDPFLTFPDQMFNSLPLDDATWVDMPTGEWCWTVWAYDEGENLTTPQFGISCFEVEE